MSDATCWMCTFYLYSRELDKWDCTNEVSVTSYEMRDANEEK
jgi:hypothetical protein